MAIAAAGITALGNINSQCIYRISKEYDIIVEQVYSSLKRDIKTDGDRSAYCI